MTRTSRWIQVFELEVGLYYTLSGVVGVAQSGFPMFNPTLIALLLWLWLPARPTVGRLEPR